MFAQIGRRPQPQGGGWRWPSRIEEPAKGGVALAQRGTSGALRRVDDGHAACGEPTERLASQYVRALVPPDRRRRQ